MPISHHPRPPLPPAMAARPGSPFQPYPSLPPSPAPSLDPSAASRPTPSGSIRTADTNHVEGEAGAGAECTGVVEDGEEDEQALRGPPTQHNQSHQSLNQKQKQKQKQTETRKRDEEPSRDPWWCELLKECKLMLTLENSGSVARDHLASERTFLAYTRTSLTIASSGVALVQIFTLSAEATDRALERFARPLGAAMIIVAVGTLAVGATRYFLVQDALIRGVYPVARISTSLIAFVVLALVVAVFVIVLAAR